MKRLFSIVTLSLLLLNFAGFYIYFVVRLKNIHSEANMALKNLPKEKLAVIKLSHTEWQKIKDNDEIEWQGKMYDIALAEASFSSVLVYALHDEAEDDLLSFIKKVVDNAQRDDQQVPSTVSSFFSLEFMQPMVCQPSSSFVYTSNRTPKHYLIKFESISLLIDSPPPRA